MQHTKTRLYGTKFCHLCEQADEIIRRAGITAAIVDITEDDHLFEKYRTRIPVLLRTDNHAELDWPFDTVTLLRFLA